MRHLNLQKLAFIIAVFLVPLACNLPGGSDPEATSTLDSDLAVEASVAQTVAASSGGQEDGEGSSANPTSAGESQDAPAATISATIEPTATPSIPVIHVSVDTNCRYGPGTVYDPPVNALLVGETAQVLGRNSEGTFYYIDKNCYVWTNYVTVEAGNINSVPIFTPVPTPTATLTPTPTEDPITFAGTWKTDCQSSTCDELTLEINGDQVTGTYANGDGEIEGTITDNHLSGIWKRNNNQGSIDFWLSDDGQTWLGNYGGYYGWCGARDGVNLPTPCSVSSWYGTWKTDCGGSNCDELILEQDGEQVSGTYAAGVGSVSGTVDGNTFSGTWDRNNNSGSFAFYLASNAKLFQGNYDGNFAWCGYNSGNAFPNPFLKP